MRYINLTLTYLLIQLAVYNRTITRCIAVDKVVYQRVRRETRLTSDNSCWTRRRLSWRSQWIILCTLEQRITSWSVPFWLVLLTEHKVLHCYATNTVFRCLVTRQLYPSCGFSPADCRCFIMLPSFQLLSANSFNCLCASYCIDR